MNTVLAMKFNLQLFADTKVPEGLVQKAWAKQLFKEAERDNFFNKFTGTTANSIIQVMSDLKKDKGDKITVPLLMRLTGEGVEGDNTLEGNEEALQFYDFSVEVDQIRHAVRLEGEMEEQKTQLNLRTQAKEGLKVWLREKIEATITAALVANPTAEHTVFAGGKSAENLLTPTDIMTCDLISIAARKAKTMTPKIRRPVINGKEYYIMLVDPYQARDLKKDQRWIDAAENCAERGSNNPIFTGMLGVWDGVVVHEYENLPRTTTGASSAVVGHALLLGCQAGVKAIAKEPYWREKTFDYGNKAGFATGMIWGAGKSVFNGKDFAVVQAMTSSAND